MLNPQNPQKSSTCDLAGKESGGLGPAGGHGNGGAAARVHADRRRFVHDRRAGRDGHRRTLVIVNKHLEIVGMKIRRKNSPT